MCKESMLWYWLLLNVLNQLNFIDIFFHHLESLFYGVMFIKLCSQKINNYNYYTKHEGGNRDYSVLIFMWHCNYIYNVVH